MKSSNKPTKSIILSKGDVIKTNPFNNFWGCAIVLDDCEKTDDFNAMCLIGIMDSVYLHNYQYNELDFNKMQLVQVDRNIRIAPYEYKHLRTEICIGIYTKKMKPILEVIGKINSFSFKTPKLSFEVGDGTNGKWPLYGPVKNLLGSEAIIEWRKINDKENFENDLKKSINEHEELLIKIKNKK